MTYLTNIWGILALSILINNFILKSCYHTQTHTHTQAITQTITSKLKRKSDKYGNITNVDISQKLEFLTSFISCMTSLVR